MWGNLSVAVHTFYVVLYKHVAQICHIQVVFCGGKMVCWRDSVGIGTWSFVHLAYCGQSVFKICWVYSHLNFPKFIYVGIGGCSQPYVPYYVRIRSRYYSRFQCHGSILVAFCWAQDVFGGRSGFVPYGPTQNREIVLQQKSFVRNN